MSRGIIATHTVAVTFIHRQTPKDMLSAAFPDVQYPNEHAAEAYSHGRKVVLGEEAMMSVASASVATDA